MVWQELLPEERDPLRDPNQRTALLRALRAEAEQAQSVEALRAVVVRLIDTLLPPEQR